MSGYNAKTIANGSAMAAPFDLTAHHGDRHDWRKGQRHLVSCQTMPRALLFVLFPDFQLLDATGPIAAFEIASRFASGAYRMRLGALEAGPVRSSASIALDAEKLGRLAGLDTLIVASGDGTRQAVRDQKLLAFLRRASKRVRRIASVCSGSLLLAQAGLLDRRRATTHWSRVRDMQRHYPKVIVEPDHIHVKD